MQHGQVQRSITSHGEPADRARIPVGNRSVMLIDERYEFLNEEILISFLAVFRIDVKRFASIRQNNDKLADLAFGRQLVEGIFRAAVGPAMVVVKKSVQEIKRWVAFGRGR